MGLFPLPPKCYQHDRKETVSKKTRQAMSADERLLYVSVRWELGGGGS